MKEHNKTLNNSHKNSTGFLRDSPVHAFDWWTQWPHCLGSKRLKKRKKEMNTFINKEALTWLKETVKTFIMSQNISISNKHCTFKLCIHQRILKKQKMFLEQQIIIFKWFLNDHVTLKTGVMMLKIQLWSQE